MYSSAADGGSYLAGAELGRARSEEKEEEELLVLEAGSLAGKQSVLHS